MTNKDRKAIYFSAFVNWLNDWNKESGNFINDLSKLKVLKLLFLWVSGNKDYLSIFDNFVAWDLWPVEKDIYDLINQNKIEGFLIDSQSLSKNLNISYEKDIQNFSNETIMFLKKKNPALIKLSASSLVDITHKWNCWNLARNYQLPVIPAELILSERWYYS